MSRITMFIFACFVSTLIFMAVALSSSHDIFREDLKENLILSAKVLKQNISNSQESMEGISNGYNKEYKDIIIDEENLISDFNAMLYRHYLNKNKYESIKQQLYVKVLVYPDRFQIANYKDLWSAPYYFTSMTSDNKQLFLNAKDNTVYYYDDANNKVEDTLDNYALSMSEKQQLIIDKINLYVSLYTKLTEADKGLVINIKNAYKNDISYLDSMEGFNPIEDVTFFVVYISSNKLELWSYLFNFNAYEVVGYTLN